jgi:hypothetical protein
MQSSDSCPPTSLSRACLGLYSHTRLNLHASSSLHSAKYPIDREFCREANNSLPRCRGPATRSSPSYETISRLQELVSAIEMPRTTTLTGSTTTCIHKGATAYLQRKLEMPYYESPARRLEQGPRPSPPYLWSLVPEPAARVESQ